MPFLVIETQHLPPSPFQRGSMEKEETLNLENMTIDEMFCAVYALQNPEPSFSNRSPRNHPYSSSADSSPRQDSLVHSGSESCMPHIGLGRSRSECLSSGSGSLLKKASFGGKSPPSHLVRRRGSTPLVRRRGSTPLVHRKHLFRSRSESLPPKGLEKREAVYAAFGTSPPPHPPSHLATRSLKSL